MNIESFLEKKWQLVHFQGHPGAGRWKTTLNLFRKLTPKQQQLATLEIERFIDSCRKLNDESLIASQTIFEIVCDASNNLFIGLENQREVDVRRAKD